MTATSNDMAARVRALQAAWRDTPDASQPEERWFADALTLDSAAIDNGQLVCLFHDAYGQRFGWRWKEAAESASDTDWPVMLMGDLSDDLINGGWTVSDADGVRWLLPEVEAQAAPGAA